MPTLTLPSRNALAVVCVQVPGGMGQTEPVRSASQRKNGLTWVNIVRSGGRRSVRLGVIAVPGVASAVFFGFRILTANNPSSQAAALPTTTSSSTSTTTTPAPSSSSTTTSANGVSPEFAAAQKALQECVARETAAKAVVDTASKAATDWGSHIQGQNDINSGARTLIQVKTETWAPTRQAGPGEVAAFQAVNAGYGGVGGCQNVSAIAAPSDLKAKLRRACAARQAALDAYVAAAGAVLNDWATHLSEMADHVGRPHQQLPGAGELAEALA